MAETETIRIVITRQKPTLGGFSNGDMEHQVVEWRKSRRIPFHAQEAPAGAELTPPNEWAPGAWPEVPETEELAASEASDTDAASETPAEEGEEAAS